MSLDEKKKRLSALSQIPSLAGTDHHLLLDQNGNLPFISQLSRNERRKLKAEARKIAEKYSNIIKKIKQSGAGFPVDKLLRELAHEYTNRYASSGTNTQPVSFNYFESFCNIQLFNNTFAPYAVPTSEIDHLFNLTDYFDYYTSNKASNFNLTSLMELPENKTLHFTTNGDILDFSILNAEGKEFVVSGFSIIRRKNSLHWYLIGGELYSDEEWKLISTDESKVTLDNIDPMKKAFLTQVIKEHDYKFGPPVSLEGTDTAIKTIITGEIDLVTQQYLSRCLMTENENSFNLISDDPDIFVDIDEIERQKMISIMKKQINHASVLWDLVNSMFQLPAYFAYKVEITKEIAIAAGRQVQKIKSTGGRGIHAKYKTVSSIDIIDSSIPIIRSVTPAHYKTNINGHWRRLTHGSIGKGPNGEVENGRTWVQAKNKWREIEEKTQPIYIKSTIRAAELKALEYEKAAESTTVVKSNEKQDYGELYVLRCIIMQEELYKVGWTSGTSENRAKQLSSATGVPISFVVVKSWKHKDAEALETSVHAMLEPYRVNDRREFFQANYHSIEKVIEAEIKRSKEKKL